MATNYWFHYEIPQENKNKKNNRLSLGYFIWDKLQGYFFSGYLSCAWKNWPYICHILIRVKKKDMFLTKYRFWKMNREPEQREDPLLEADPSHLLALLNYLRPHCLKFSDLYNCQIWEIIGGCDKHLYETCETGRCLPRADHWHRDCVLAWFSSNILSWMLQARKGKNSRT